MAQNSPDTCASPPARARLRGMAGFTLVWAGQMVSVLASNMSHFALTIWAFQQTGSATALGIMQAAFSLPLIALSPFVGAMVDRYNRKVMMMLSDLVAALATTAILLLNINGSLQIWHLYITSALLGLGSSFQWPAYMAAITAMLPKQHYARANGMMLLVETGPGVLSPLLAGALLPLIGLTGILTIDVLTFFLAIGALLIVIIPRVKQSEEGRAASGSLLQEALFGFKFIFSRRSLLIVHSYALLLNLVHSLGEPVLSPMLLLRTSGSSAALGSVLSVGAVGGVVGGLAVSIWGGFRQKMRGVLFAWFTFGVFGLILFGLGRSLWVWMPVIFVAYGSYPLAQSAYNAIWQSKVPPDLQGRVFSARRMIAWMPDPFMPVLAGLLADHVTEPAMTSGAALARTFGWMVGNTPGSGMALQFVLCGVVYVALVVAAFFIPSIRRIETILPDHDAVPSSEDADKTAPG